MRLMKLYVGIFFCICINNVCSTEIVSILDYGTAKYFSYSSPGNQLYINIEGRMNIKKGQENLEYILLAPHPREFTWRLDKRPYSDMIDMSKGASTIAFIMEKGGNSVISRRFEA